MRMQGQGSTFAGGAQTGEATMEVGVKGGSSQT